MKMPINPKNMNKAYNWYSQLKKPSWAPPRWLFGPVWTVLYVIIAITFFDVFYQTSIGLIAWTVALPFVFNLIFNFAFAPLQFGLKNNFLSAIDILLVLITLIWALAIVQPLLPWAAYANIPYLLWVCFATILQLAVTYLNRK
jgi:benzodiazapine receptor